jgi:hypothetical protein
MTLTVFSGEILGPFAPLAKIIIVFLVMLMVLRLVSKRDS